MARISHIPYHAIAAISASVRALATQGGERTKSTAPWARANASVQISPTRPASPGL